jgi:hypothetical protein
MSKPKVYLAKSNRANPNYVSKVRQKLQEYDIEIVEFTGGKYDVEDLLRCDQLVVIPEIDKQGKVKPLGKGLYTQIFEFSKEKSCFGYFSFDYVFFLADENFNFYEIEKIEIEDLDNYVEHAKVTLGDDDNMFVIFEEDLDFVKITNDKIIINTNKEITPEESHTIIKL